MNVQDYVKKNWLPLEGRNIRLGRSYTFDAAHFLPGHPKCGALHGHTWTVTVFVDGMMKGDMVIDFHSLNEMVRDILKAYDHTNLNRLLHSPTVENITNLICSSLIGRIKEKGEIHDNIEGVGVEVQEGDGGWASIWRGIEGVGIEVTE
jgi:6-pyruvoyltetrahydropterin/6-carboxytetrahydropterin synthase